MKNLKIQKGDLVEILKAYQDEGDDELIWMAIDDEEKERVTVMPVNSTLSIKPTYVMKVEWLRLKKRGNE
jgi:imidazole glycerol phosphate synthase subunit HisF